MMNTFLTCKPPADAGDSDHPGLSIAWGNCGHVFHLDCIQRWLKTRSACPLCNKVRDMTGNAGFSSA